MRNTILTLSILLPLLFMGGCSTAPKYDIKPLELSNAFSSTLDGFSYLELPAGGGSIKFRNEKWASGKFTSRFGNSSKRALLYTDGDAYFVIQCARVNMFGFDPGGAVVDQVKRKFPDSRITIWETNVINNIAMTRLEMISRDLGVESRHVYIMHTWSDGSAQLAVHCPEHLYSKYKDDFNELLNGYTPSQKPNSMRPPPDSMQTQVIGTLDSNAPWKPQLAKISPRVSHQPDITPDQRDAQLNANILEEIAKQERTANRPYPQITEIKLIKAEHEIWHLKSEDSPRSYLVIIDRLGLKSGSATNYSVMRWSDFSPGKPVDPTGSGGRAKGGSP